MTVDTFGPAHTLLLCSSAVAAVDARTGISVYSLEGRVLLARVIPPGLSVTTPFASTGTSISLCPDTLAVSPRLIPKAEALFFNLDSTSARGSGPVPAPTALQLTHDDIPPYAVALSQSPTTPGPAIDRRRLVAALGADGSLAVAYAPCAGGAEGRRRLAGITGALPPRSVRLRAHGTTSFAWHATADILAAVCPGDGDAPAIVVWLSPAASLGASADSTLLCATASVSVADPTGIPAAAPASIRVGLSTPAPSRGVGPAGWAGATATDAASLPCWGVAPLIASFSGSRLAVSRAEDGGAILVLAVAGTAAALSSAIRTGAWDRALAIVRIAGGVDADVNESVPHLWAMIAAAALEARPPALAVAATAFQALAMFDRAAFLRGVSELEPGDEADAEMAAYRGDLGSAESMLLQGDASDTSERRVRRLRRALELSIASGGWDHALQLVEQPPAPCAVVVDHLLVLRTAYLTEAAVVAQLAAGGEGRATTAVPYDPEKETASNYVAANDRHAGYSALAKRIGTMGGADHAATLGSNGVGQSPTPLRPGSRSPRLQQTPVLNRSPSSSSMLTSPRHTQSLQRATPSTLSHVDVSDRGAGNVTHGRAGTDRGSRSPGTSSASPRPRSVGGIASASLRVQSAVQPFNSVDGGTAASARTASPVSPQGRTSAAAPRQSTPALPPISPPSQRTHIPLSLPSAEELQEAEELEF